MMKINCNYLYGHMNVCRVIIILPRMSFLQFQLFHSLFPPSLFVMIPSCTSRFRRLIGMYPFVKLRFQRLLSISMILYWKFTGNLHITVENGLNNVCIPVLLIINIGIMINIVIIFLIIISQHPWTSFKPSNTIKNQ